MCSINRNGKPPKDKLNKVILTFSEFDFDEDQILNWCYQNLESSMQYDFIVFQPESFKMKDIEFTGWFHKKSDLELFKKVWANG